MVPKTSSSLAPGFRFHPTDEELVRYYLRRKILGKPFYDGAISEIDIYKAEPWDLPGKSALKSRDLEWYFFSGLDKKYGNGDRTNRATDQGYWKTTGKDRPVYHKCQVVGMKKTLVYHNGRAPKGQRTNWVMHEYRLIDEHVEKAGFAQDLFVLCRVFQKSGSGPKNGEQYGAPFIEEEWEWEGDELEMVPKLEAADEGGVGNDSCLDGIDLEQILATGAPADDAPIPLDNYDGQNATNCEETADSNNNSQKVCIGVGEYNCMTKQSEGNNLDDLPVHQDMYQELVDDSQISVGACEYHSMTEQSEEQRPYDLPFEYSMHQNPVKNEFIAEPSQIMNPIDAAFILDQPYMDAMDDLQFGDGAFLEANDLDNPILDASGGGLLDEYITFFDASDEYLTFDNPEILDDNGTPVSGEPTLSQQDFKNETQPAVMANQQPSGDNIDDASSSKLQSKDYASDFQHPFLKQASCMLESIHAPPAFASEFPSKDSALRLYASSSGTAHVTAGMIEIENTGLAGQGMNWLSEKHGRYNIVLSIGLSRGIDNSTTLESVVRIQPGKTASGIFRGWYCFMFFWVLILSMSFKIGTCICAK